MNNTCEIWLLLVAAFFITPPVWSQSDSYLGLEHARNGNCSMAIRFFERALSAGETEWWIYNNLASCFLETRQYEQALNTAQKGYSHFPEQDDMKNKLIIVLFEMVQDNFRVNLEWTFAQIPVHQRYNSR